MILSVGSFGEEMKQLPVVVTSLLPTSIYFELDPGPIPASQIWPAIPSTLSLERFPRDSYVTRPGLLSYGDSEASTETE